MLAPESQSCYHRAYHGEIAYTDVYFRRLLAELDAVRWLSYRLITATNFGSTAVTSTVSHWLKSRSYLEVLELR